MFVYVSGTGRVLPSCANAGFPTRWAFDVSADRGKAMASVLLTAQALNQSVSIDGTGSCTPGWSGGDIENIGWIGAS